MTDLDRKEVKDLASKHINGITLKILIPVIGTIISSTGYIVHKYDNMVSIGEQRNTMIAQHDSSLKSLYVWKTQIDNLDLPDVKKQVEAHQEFINYWNNKPMPHFKQLLVNR